MKNKIAKFLIIALFASSVAACQQETTGKYGRTKPTTSTGISKSDAGTVLGGIGGAFIGAQVGKGSGQLVATAAGALLGAYLGNSIGASLDEGDLAYYDRTSQSALASNKVGQTSTWKNPDSGNSGTITPTRAFSNASKQSCKEYTQTIQVGSKTERAYGTACRQADGSWKIVQ
jgi:surface antigen